MQNIQIFNNSEFGTIRTVIVEGKDYFYGVDVAKALMYERPSKAVSDHCKGILTLDTLKNDGGYPEKLIPEGDIYRLTVKASEQNTNKEIKAKAEKFERWIFDEVLPALRRTGTYTLSTAYQHPVSPAALDSATNAGRLIERIMKSEGCYPYEIAMIVKSIFGQAGIELHESFVKIPEYQQITLPLGYSEITGK